MKQITFVSYRGGTGKTTLAANLSALLAKNGQNVCILDMDIYAPSLHSYFGDMNHYETRKTINNFLIGKCKVNDILVEITPILQLSEKGYLSGKIFACFASPKREDILKVEAVIEDKNRMNILKNFINLRKDLDEKYNIDYLIVDTGPGIYSITRALFRISDIAVFVIRTGEVDNTGLASLTNYILAVNEGRKNNMYYLVVNMFSGYCVPDRQLTNSSDCTNKGDCTLPPMRDDFIRMLRMIDSENAMKLVPCYCDIQFSRREFLTVLKYPDHPFSQKINELKALINIQ
ncbi:MAG TPA: AAA family ATPase [Nitrososphaeraceae archaeon]|nr:AAA family ATPase [Nitrososphaeraceae archaeon]